MIHDETERQGVTVPHILAVAEDGERLAFGSLWTSEDQGDRWPGASNHVPPVLCMVFET